jgi:acyl-ACP thioesterase
VFEEERRAGLADAGPGGRVRLDAIARWLQDVAYSDILDAGVAHLSLWVVRRTRIRVARFPAFGEQLRMRTWGSATGRLWAERRTSIEGSEGAAIEAVGLWIHLDPASRRPVSPPDAVQRIYSPSANGRVVKARLRHARPPEDAERAGWRFRATDVDIAEHVNNAAYWEPLEERLAAAGDPDALDAEIEFRDPALPGDAVLLSTPPWLWITRPDGLLHASIVTG